jgi:ribosomal protein L1
MLSRALRHALRSQLPALRPLHASAARLQVRSPLIVHQPRLGRALRYSCATRCRRVSEALSPLFQDAPGGDATLIAPLTPPKVAPLPADVLPVAPPPPVAAAGPPPVPLPRLVPAVKRAPLPLPQAVAAVKALRRARFVESVELTVRLGIDPKRSDQIVRGVAALPHGTGRRVRIAVFATGDAADAARAAGADVVGGEELVAKIKAGGSGALDFDKAIATPASMPLLAPIARVLGPKGLMPNPKVGTLTTDVAAAVVALRQGQVQFRTDRASTIHCAVGKADFSDAALMENAAALALALAAARPKGVKAGKAGSAGAFFKSAHLATSMGRGSVPIDIASLAAAAGMGGTKAAARATPA